MKIGFVAFSEKQIRLRSLVKILAKDSGIEVFNYYPSDAEIYKKKNIKNSNLVEYPEIIDNIDAFYIRNLKKNELFKNTLILREYRSHKKDIQDKIIRNSKFKKMAIDTYMYGDCKVEELLKKYKEIIIKQANSFGGKGKIRLTREGKNFIVQNGHEIEKISEKKFYRKYDENFRNNLYYVQPFLNFKTSFGNPFDIRLVVTRGENGKCVSMNPIIRIGNIAGIVSNMVLGGYGITFNIKNFFIQEFGFDADRIIEELNEVSKKLFEVFQKRYFMLIPSVGFDIGIDKNSNNEIKFIEINGCPSIIPAIEYDYAKARVDYYKFIIENYDNLLVTQKNR